MAILNAMSYWFFGELFIISKICSETRPLIVEQQIILISDKLVHKKSASKPIYESFGHGFYLFFSIRQTKPPALLKDERLFLCI